MAMKTLRIDGEWVRRLVGLAERPWEQAEIERALLAHGWAEADEDGAVVVGWGGGACAPHFFGEEDEGSEESKEGLGRRLELGVPPVGGGPEDPSFVQLPCALFWPPFGAELDDDWVDEDEEDDLDGDYSAVWARFPDARRADFHTEYDRLAALVTAELGEPDETVTADLDEHQEIWHRNGLQVVLHRSDDINTYSHYDVINLRVGPAAAWRP